MLSKRKTRRKGKGDCCLSGTLEEKERVTVVLVERTQNRKERVTAFKRQKKEGMTAVNEVK